MKVVLNVIFLIFCCNCFAQTYSGSGKVSVIRSHDLDFSGANQDWFAINGFVTAGSCGKQGESVVLRLKDDSRGERQYSIALAALMAGKNVSVSVDDTDKDSGGYCFLRHIDIQP